MALNRDYAVMIEDMLKPLGAVSVRAMFGGGGVYLDGVMFALIADDVLFFKADEQGRKAFEEEGMAPFTYEGKGKAVTMSYWQAPDRLFDDQDEMIEFARRAIDVARGGKTRKPARKKTSGKAR